MATALVSPQQPCGWKVTSAKQISRHGCCSQDKGTASTTSVVPINYNKAILHLFLFSFRIKLPSQMQADNAGNVPSIRKTVIDGVMSNQKIHFLLMLQTAGKPADRWPTMVDLGPGRQ